MKGDLFYGVFLLVAVMLLLGFAAADALRSPLPGSHWGIVADKCAVCESTRKCEVHHIIPQAVAPQLAYDTNNMVVLCRECHFRLGHAGNFHRYVTNLPAVIGMRVVVPIPDREGVRD